MAGTPFITAPAATEAQVRFIGNLIGQKDWRTDAPAKFVGRIAVLNMMIGWVLGTITPLDAVAEVMTADTLGERVNQLLAHSATGSSPEYAYSTAPLTKDGASKLITWLKDRPKAAESAAPAAPADEDIEGIWTDNAGNIIKVQKAVHGSGNLYAKLMDADNGSFLYVAGLVNDVRKGVNGMRRLTTEEAANYGHLYGRCIVCSRTLTDETSIAAGIGPVCGGRFAA